MDSGIPLISDKAKLEKIIGRELPEAVFDLKPWGHRIIVVREDPVKITEGGIHIPDAAVRPVAAGWVLSVGHCVGLERMGSVGFCPFEREYLLGTKVVFAAHAGVNIKLTDQDDDFNSQWLLMTDNDIFFHEGQPPAESISNTIIEF